MREILTQVITSAGAAAVLIAAVGWLLRSWIAERLKSAVKHEYDERLESHKAQLKANYDVEIARLNFQFAQTTIEHQVRFSGLYAKRADVISQAYTLLVKAHREAHYFASPIQYLGGPEVENQYVATLNALGAFFDYFDENQLWLPTSVCQKISPLVEEMRAKIVMYGIYRQMPEIDMSVDTRRHKDEAWQATWKFFREEMPAARTTLEDELRSLLAGSN
jgi:hypothetical protein